MVEGERDGSAASNDDRVVPDDRPRRHSTDAQDRNLRVVDDGRLEEPGELARARHRERRPAQLFGRERTRASALGEVGDLGGELVDGLFVHPADNRDDEPVVGLHCDADVVPVQVEDRVPVEARVQLRVLGEGVGARPDDGRQETVEGNVLEVALLDPGHGRHLAVSARHVLGDHTADAAQRLAPPFARRDRGVAHVVLRDPAARAAARNSHQIDAELLRDAADDRGRLHAAGLGGRCRRRSTGCGRLTGAPMTTSSVPTGTTSPSATRTCSTVPAYGDGISTVALSVWISTSGSSSAIPPLRYEPASDLALGEALTEIRELERVATIRDSRVRAAARASAGRGTRASREPRAR